MLALTFALVVTLGRINCSSSIREHKSPFMLKSVAKQRHVNQQWRARLVRESLACFSRQILRALHRNPVANEIAFIAR
ncbi:hypothetical protein [Burkholderia ubonensis]|uniref:hypothetical protein n=1 Tax=Burkholderia ubonensis TaxID=101571 RepID=UPI000A91423C|nr:hypothetical protein [Burkholderia ubonensis]